MTLRDQDFIGTSDDHSSEKYKFLNISLACHICD